MGGNKKKSNRTKKSGGSAKGAAPVTAPAPARPATAPAPGGIGRESPEWNEQMMAYKGRLWRQWFAGPIPMLNDQTPVVAATTAAGRRNLEELFAMYDRLNTRPPGVPQGAGEAFQANAPTPWTKWKLGMGPGSAEEFAEEERIFNAGITEQPTARNASHERKLLKKQGAIFVPKRCEFAGCSKVGDEVRKCDGCKLASYCGREHQVADWKHHKRDCKHLKHSECKRRYFSTDEELIKYPMGCFPLPAPGSAARLKCFICGAGEGEVKLGFTDCCNAPVCNNEDEYVSCSYSQDFCKRSHSRYTCCGYHGDEGHAGDWRECVHSECQRMRDVGEGTAAARSWHSTNGFNLTPALESSLPQGSLITKPCSECKGRITPGHDTESTRGHGAVCVRCTDEGTDLEPEYEPEPEPAATSVA